MRMVSCIALAAALGAAGARAQDFPAGVGTPTAAEIQQRLAGKSFDVKLANGTGWRLDYKDSGYFFMSTSTAYSDSGKWRTEDGRLCHEPRKTNAGCNEVRIREAALLMKRDSGEIIEFLPRP